ncbi:hypothetical protein [Mycolicibacter arupensis]|jgi:hypothetical protein|uniref:Uncharacterized protein n=1 Tax=Mycolicibacter arupensis TaxID=342002 RepID=A0A5C7XYK7_9MYCO|nr:hypothetical protein [Mycolicibacter arupensis]MCV7277077.1 hypothetical protein [Mycolicibacter arupensis]TXI54453.1 MAG: hypothetical protein E6Q54_14730 [Mycolicibacter arupensis]
MNNPGQPMILQQIIITRSLQPCGAETYSVAYEGGVGWVEGLGLLEAAKWDLHAQCNPVPNEDRD